MTFRFTTLSLPGIKKERVQKMSDYTPSRLLLRCAHGDGIFFVSTNGVPTRINYHRQFEPFVILSAMRSAPRLSHGALAE